MSLVNQPGKMREYGVCSPNSYDWPDYLRNYSSFLSICGSGDILMV